VRYVLIKQNSNYTTIILFLKTKLKVNKAHVPHSAHDSSDGQNQIFIRFRLNRFLNLIKYLIQALQDSIQATWDLTLIRFGNFSHSIQRTSDFAKKSRIGHLGLIMFYVL